MSGLGVVHNFVIYHKPWTPYYRDKVPYALVQVEIAEGPRLTTNLLDAAGGAGSHRASPWKRCGRTSRTTSRCCNSGRDGVDRCRAACWTRTGTGHQVRMSEAEARALGEAIAGPAWATRRRRRRIITDQMVDNALCGYRFASLPRILAIAG